MDEININYKTGKESTAKKFAKTIWKSQFLCIHSGWEVPEKLIPW